MQNYFLHIQAARTEVSLKNIGKNEIFLLLKQQQQINTVKFLFLEKLLSTSDYPDYLLISIKSYSS